MGRYTYPEAAEALRVTETWLRRHIGELPHSKLGRVVLFTDSDLDRIGELFHSEPSTGPLAAAARAGAGAHPLAHLTPIPSRSRRLRSA